MNIHLVLIETASNQDFIFATNKLRENIGASEIIYRIGTQFVLEAVARETGLPNPWWPQGDGAPPAETAPHPRSLVEWLCNKKKNPAIDGPDNKGVEVVVATSGKAVLLVGSRGIGERIVAHVTRTALEKTPGAVVRGYVSGPFEFDDANVFDEAVVTVHREIETLRARLPAPEARFAMLPVDAPCQTSGLPAKAIFPYGRRPEKDREAEDKEIDAPLPDDCAAPIWAKREMRIAGWRRMKMLADDEGKPKEKLAKDISRLEDMDLDWHAVVHADGNGVGAIFLEFLGRSGAKSARQYVDAYRNFSISLELCTLAAFTKALDTLKPRTIRLKKRRTTDAFLPLVPLVLGGDDLTVVCDGKSAVDFAAAYLKEFERQSSEETSVDFDGFNVPKIAGRRLAACAGVAVVKPHFPFHRAYLLAEGLLKSAKDVKRKLPGVPCSALDFHVHFDSSGADLDSIREKLEVVDVVLTAKPYVVTSLDDLSAARAGGRQWASLRYWNEVRGSNSEGQATEIVGLSAAAGELARRGDRDEGGNLPRGQQHYLREGLFLGKDIANGRLSQIAHRYDQFHWEKLRPNHDREEAMKDMFFIDALANEDRIRKNKSPADLTWFLDALELAELRGASAKTTDEEDTPSADRRVEETAP